MTKAEIANNLANQLNLVPNIRVIALDGARIMVAVANGRQRFTVTVAETEKDDFEDCA